MSSGERQMKEFANISKDIKSGATEIQTANVVGTVDSTAKASTKNSS